MLIGYKVENNIITDACVFDDEETVTAHGYTLINHEGLDIEIGDDVSDLNALKSQKDSIVIELSTHDVRHKRNMLLAETDWWASSDLTMTTEQIAYRQSLRDLPSDENFPNVNFPIKP